MRDRSGASTSQFVVSQSLFCQIENGVELSAARAAQRGREIRERARAEEDELLWQKKEEARKQAEKNDEKKMEREKVNVEDLRAKRLAALGV